MNKQGWELVAGLAMIVGGAVLYFVFRDVETPVVGLRQAGLVIAALGGIEMVVAGWLMTRPGRPGN